MITLGPGAELVIIGQPGQYSLTVVMIILLLDK